MRDVAVVSFAQSPHVRREQNRNEVEILMPVVREARERSGIAHDEIDFVCSGSTDYLAGQSFAFVAGLDGIGAWPPVSESHVEMDGAWALYEAWVKIQMGYADTALVYGFGKSSPGDLPEVMALQLDPYVLTPLWPDAVSMAALQARKCLDEGVLTEADMAAVAARDRRHAESNPFAQVKGSADPEALLAEPTLVSPLRKHDCAPISDGAAAVILAADDVARRVCERPAWISGIHHIVEPQDPGLRDLTRSRSTEIAADKAGVGAGTVDVAEIHGPFTHQEILIEKALGLGPDTTVNPSGGALAANPMMTAGLIRIGEAARRIQDGSAGRTVAHATSGPCLQQNLVCVMEGR
ncbi:MAG: thiolase domain-containing protein [Myxococcota bacterium]|nr:thiolase domain-containing protein [Myxococcota bacterium]